MTAAEEALEAAAAHEVRVRRKGEGIAVEIRVETLDDVGELTRRLAKSRSR